MKDRGKLGKRVYYKRRDYPQKEEKNGRKG